MPAATHIRGQPPCVSQQSRFARRAHHPMDLSRKVIANSSTSCTSEFRIVRFTAAVLTGGRFEVNFVGRIGSTSKKRNRQRVDFLGQDVMNHMTVHICESHVSPTEAIG